MELHFDTPDVIQLRNALYNMARRGVPHAARNALNTTAFVAREQWQRELTFSRLVLRNHWTRRSIQVTPARGVDVRSMQSVVGSTASYMLTQEQGGTEQKKHKHGVAIPTSVASGEGRGAKPRRRLVRTPNRLPKIQLTPRGRAGTREQRNATAMRKAIKAGRKHVFLELENKQGIFRLRGGKRRPKVDLVWDISKASVRIPPTPTLQPTLARMGPHITRAIQGAFIDQLQRHRVARF